MTNRPAPSPSRTRRSIAGALVGAALLAAVSASLARPPAPPPPTPAAPPTSPTSPTPPGRPTDPEQIIRDLERATRPPSSPEAPAARAPGPAPATIPGSRLLREGSFLTDRRARLSRGSGGEWQAVFDADAAGQADPPMTLQPCQNLQAMEAIVEGGSPNAVFSLSGQVFVYRGRNYLLPLIYRIERRGDVTTGG